MAQRLLLAIDASAPCSALALGWVPTEADSGPGTSISGMLGGDERIDGANQASATLDLRIRTLFEQANLGLDQLKLLACGRGPGTFTGTRVALATAQGLASSLACECVSLTTLDALAWSLRSAAAPAVGSVLTALLDARRGEVYARSFEVTTDGLRAIDDAQCIDLQSYLACLKTPPGFAVGPGVEPYRSVLPSTCETLVPEHQLMGPTAEGLWQAAIANFRSAGTHDVRALRPLYLRATYAELGINKPKRERYVSPFV